MIVAKEEFDFCELTALQGNPCPIPAGPFSFNTTRQIASNIPPATITLKIESKNFDGKQIDCQEGKVVVFKP